MKSTKIKMKNGRETATEARNSGFFTNINKDTYEQASNLVKEKLNSSLAEILGHIIIVGGAEKIADTDGYQSPEWASYGNAIDIAAPALDLHVDSDKEDEEDPIPVRGTSFATPMVSGAVALIWSYNPDMAARDVKEILLNSAQEHVVENKGAKCSYPMLNMTAFLNEYAPNIAEIETDFSESFHYNELEEAYRTAIREQWKENELVERGLGPYEFYGHPLRYDYGYELRDINGNGLPELIVGVYREDGEAEIREIYTLQNNEPVKVFESGIRTHLHIYKDGTIEYNGVSSPGRGIYVRTFYRLDDDGSEQWKEGYGENMAEESFKCLLGPRTSSATNPGIDPDGSEIEEYVETINETIRKTISSSIHLRHLY